MSGTRAAVLRCLFVALPFAALYLLWRVRAPARSTCAIGASASAGRAAAQKWRARRIWMHAVSVGETRAAQPLIEALVVAVSGARILLTHMTPTGRATGKSSCAAARPVRSATCPTTCRSRSATSSTRSGRPRHRARDRSVAEPALRRARARHPDGARQRAAVRAVARARPRFASLMRRPRSAFRCIAAQTEADARGCAALRCADRRVIGNLKFDLAPDATQVDAGARCGRLRRRAVRLFATTREGEEELLLDALRRMMCTPPAAR